MKLKTLVSSLLSFIFGTYFIITYISLRVFDSPSITWLMNKSDC